MKQYTNLQTLLTNCFFIVVLVAIIGCIEKRNINVYINTSEVNYSNRNSIKLVEEEYYKTSFVNFLKIKLSINIPIDSWMNHEDSVIVQNYIDSLISTRKIEPNTTNISVVVFKETNYTNQIFLKKERLLFCEDVPCIYSMSITSNGIKHPANIKTQLSVVF